jgi:N-acetyl-alpha-D-muramate 1-phosphate uridylyltransferase
MKAMVLAAGLGTRLGVISKETPKCLVEVGGLPILEHVLIKLKAAGIVSVVVNLHHLSDQVERFIKAKDSFGIKIEFSAEESLLDTGGGIKKAQSFLEQEDNFLVHNADVYSEINLLDLIDFHQKQKPLATLAVKSCKSDRYLLCDDKGKIIGWISERSGCRNISSPDASTQKVDFCGIHVASRKVFDYFSKEQGAFSIFTPYMKAAREGHHLLAYSMKDAYWMDIGTPQSLEELNKKLRTQKD